MYGTMCMTQNMGVIFFENGGVWHKMYDTKIATNYAMRIILQNAFVQKSAVSLHSHKWSRTKMYTTSDTIFWHSSSCLFKKVWSLLFGVLAPWTIFLLVIACSKSEASIYMGFRANTPNKMYHTMLEKLRQKMVQEIVNIFIWGHFWL